MPDYGEILKTMQDVSIVSHKSHDSGSHKTSIKQNLLSPFSSSLYCTKVQVQEDSVTGSYPSQLRSPNYLADHLLSSQDPPYTPPPMLSPVRPGPGLYFNTLPQHQSCPLTPSTFTVSVDRKDWVSLALDDTVISKEPQINVGSHFQAEIPPLRNQVLTQQDEHPAQLVWAPWGDMSTNPETQKRVADFLNLCSSSVLPGGGTNTELALHCLHKMQGDTMATLNLLLGNDLKSFLQHDYHYTGSDQWTVKEMRLFQNALLHHKKDFLLIHKELQTKSVAQCVEYYYIMKKLEKFRQRSNL